MEKQIAGESVISIYYSFFKITIIFSKAQIFWVYFLDAPATYFPVIGIKVELIRQFDHFIVAKNTAKGSSLVEK